MNLSEKPPHKIEHAGGEATAPQALSLLNYTENAQPPLAAAAVPAQEKDYRARSGMRVLRASPLILVSCGIVFASLIFLLDLKAQTDARAEQATASRTVSNSPAKGQTVPASSVSEEKATANAPVATQTPADSPVTTAAPLQAASPAPASPNGDEELAGQRAALATNPPAGSEVKAALVEEPRANHAADEGNFTLQVGSFNNAAEANERVARLGSLGIPSYVAKVEIPKRGTWYRVQTGSFSSREEAARYGTELRNRGSVADFIITERRAS